MNTRWTLALGNFNTGYTGFFEGIESVYQFYKNQSPNNITLIKIEHIRKNEHDLGKYIMIIWLTDKIDAETFKNIHINCLNFVFSETIADEQNRLTSEGGILELRCLPDKKELLKKFIEWVSKNLDCIDNLTQQDIITKLNNCPLPQLIHTTNKNSSIFPITHRPYQNITPLQTIPKHPDTYSGLYSNPYGPQMFRFPTPGEQLNKLFIENQHTIDTISYKDQKKILITVFDFNTAKKTQAYLQEAYINVELCTALENNDQDQIYNLLLTYQQYQQVFGKDSLNNILERNRNDSVSNYHSQRF